MDDFIDDCNILYDGVSVFNSSTQEWEIHRAKIHSAVFDTPQIRACLGMPGISAHCGGCHKCKIRTDAGTGQGDNRVRVDGQSTSFYAAADKYTGDIDAMLRSMESVISAASSQSATRSSNLHSAATGGSNAHVERDGSVQQRTHAEFVLRGQQADNVREQVLNNVKQQHGQNFSHKNVEDAMKSFIDASFGFVRIRFHICNSNWFEFFFKSHCWNWNWF
jgi:hypothetical protein